MAKSKKLVGGGIIGRAANFIYSATLFVSLLMMIMSALFFLALLVAIYFLMNGVLAGTNLVIDVLNAVITPIIKLMVDIVNGVIDGINSFAG
jgi:hypothetical protein